MRRRLIEALCVSDDPEDAPALRKVLESSDRSERNDFWNGTKGCKEPWLRAHFWDRAQQPGLSRGDAIERLEARSLRTTCTPAGTARCSIRCVPSRRRRSPADLPPSVLLGALHTGGIEAFAGHRALCVMHRAVGSLDEALASRSVAPDACDFATVYDALFDDVLRWMAAMGAPGTDLEDLAQEVFLVVERKLSDFDGRNLQGWIYGIARKVVASHRRRAWVRSLFLRRVEEASSPYVPATPVALLERKQAWQLVDRALARMSDKRRRVFVLFEIEGYSGEEIAALEGVPIKTIWTRLHHARKDFVALTSACEQKERG